MDRCRHEPQGVAVWAGHTSVSVVLDCYGHLLPGTEERVTDALDAMARGASATPREAKIRAPDPTQLEAVAGFFGVSRRYLLDDTVAAAVEEDIETGQAINKLEVNGIHLRQLAGLRNDQLRFVRALIRELAADTPNNQEP